MRLASVAISGVCLLSHEFGYATVVGSGPPGRQVPLGHSRDTTPQSKPSQQLHGRFLHITDIHPDPFYKVHSSPKQACHRGKGTAGIYGTADSDCDTPYSLINATLEWIEENIKDDIDFVVWTGDSARHDSDEKIPRDADQVFSSNKWMADRLRDVFRRTDNSHIPIVPTIGNNDILPHNILTTGPNKWLKAFSGIWKKFIPEEQRHGFERGGWFYVEVIPNKLAVFSLNTLYFFAQNAGVDGCDSRSEPGFQHMEWLRIQLQFMRERGMKAILIGHVPPARTRSKQVWDETCWQKYTLWLNQYRDVVVSAMYGHMNIDHFMFQDTKDIDILGKDQLAENRALRETMDDEPTIGSIDSYLDDLRHEWSNLPKIDVEKEANSMGKKEKKGKESKKDKALRKIGGPWGERYQVSFVSPSIIPNYFPTIRVIHYNITGLDGVTVGTDVTPRSETAQQDHLPDQENQETEPYIGDLDDDDEHSGPDVEESMGKKKKKKKGKKGKEKPKHPDLTVPPPPSKKSPPGPAYSPQTLTLLGYTQYFANLTAINNELEKLEALAEDASNQGSNDKIPKPKPFKFEVEYDTLADPLYNLEDMTVRSYIKLAHRIGQYKPLKGDQLAGPDPEGLDTTKPKSGDEDDPDAEKKKGKKHRKQLEKNKPWLEFIRRAYVGVRG